jgi:uncharacterized protein
MNQSNTKNKSYHCVTCGVKLPLVGSEVTKLSHFPFCSSRCKMLDLGRWAQEEYFIEGSLSDLEAEDVQEE